MQTAPHRRRLFRACLPLVIAVLSYLAAGLVNRWVLDVDLRYFGPPLKLWKLYLPGLNFNASLLPDLLAQIALGYVLFALSKRWWIGSLLHVFLIAFLYVGNGVKIAYFGEPWVATDWFLVRELLGVLPLPLAWLAGALALAPIVTFIVNLRITVRRALAVGIVAFPLLGVAGLEPRAINRLFAAQYGFLGWAPIKNFAARGATLYVVDEILRFSASRTLAPGAGEVARALDVLATRLPETGPRQLRNVHVLAMESLWDPTLLPGFRYSAPVWDPRFRALWERSGRATVMSPVFGGGTANAEYEALCGFPADLPRMMFQTEVRQSDVPCLPQLLRAAGYRTLASHPNRGGFWNRNSAFPRIGFERFLTIGDFALDDLRGPYLSDASLLRQNRDLVDGLDGTAPTFNYVMSIAAHWPYHGRVKDVHEVTSSPSDALLSAYASSMRESTAVLYEHLVALQARDPEALIVVFGDHLPLLGPHFEVYRKGGRLGRDLAAFTARDARFEVSTPLIVIDGRLGPLALGSVPMYRLPALMLERLGLPSSLMNLTAPREEGALRPVKGVGILTLRGSRAALCRLGSSDESCVQAERRLHAAHVVARDLNLGGRHALDRLTPDTATSPSRQARAEAR